jgi:hypothetical protein
MNENEPNRYSSKYLYLWYLRGTVVYSKFYFIFFFWDVTLCCWVRNSLWSFETWGTNYPLKQRNIPEDSTAWSFSKILPYTWFQLGLYNRLSQKSLFTTADDEYIPKSMYLNKNTFLIFNSRKGELVTVRAISHVGHSTEHEELVTLIIRMRRFYR